VKAKVRTMAGSFLIEDCLLGEAGTAGQFHTDPVFPRAAEDTDGDHAELRRQVCRGV
jgi:hypothetical protein